MSEQDTPKCVIIDAPPPMSGDAGLVGLVNEAGDVFISTPSKGKWTHDLDWFDETTRDLCESGTPCRCSLPTTEEAQ